MSAQLKPSLQRSQSDEIKAGWDFTGPRVHLVGDFGPAIHLAADIASDGTVLSDAARDAWLEERTIRLANNEAERRLDELARLGPAWSAHRGVFLRLLTSGRI